MAPLAKSDIKAVLHTHIHTLTQREGGEEREWESVGCMRGPYLCSFPFSLSLRMNMDQTP